MSEVGDVPGPGGSAPLGGIGELAAGGERDGQRERLPGTPEAPQRSFTSMAKKKVDYDLMALWDDKGVPAHIQRKLSDANFTTMSRFAQLADDRKDARKMALEELGLGAEGLSGRAAAASVIDAWEWALTSTTVRREKEAEAKVLRQPLTLIRNDHLMMKTSFEEAFFRLSDKHVPSHGYVEKKFESIAEGDFRAEPLNEIVARPDEEEDSEGLTWDLKTNCFRIKKSKVMGKMPETSEEFRDKMRLMMVADHYSKARYPNRDWLQDVTPEMYERHIDYFLGEHVARLEAKDANGMVVSIPPWRLVLSYEYQVRKLAYKFIAEGRVGKQTLAAALEAAREDLTTKERFFLTPMQIGARSYSSGDSAQNARNRSRSRNRQRNSKKAKNQSQSRGKGNGSSKGGRANANGGGAKGGKKKKGGGKGNLPIAPPGMVRNTKNPNGKLLCYAFNLKDEQCSKQNCTMSHTCWWCFDKHPGHTCKTIRDAAQQDRAGDRGGRKGDE
jgi:hypothetical protein